jgi:hypothetical protein
MENKGSLSVVPTFDVEGPSDCSYKGNKKGLPNYGKLKTWKEIEQDLETILFSGFRLSCTDSQGNPIKYTWFWLDWSGFLENPREQVCGYHAVYDHLKKFFRDNMTQYNDEDAIHYHNPRQDGSWFSNETYPFEQWNTQFQRSPFEQILAHHLIDKRWFPTAFRAGGSIEDEALSQFLNCTIPIDFSCRGDGSFSIGKNNQILYDWCGTPSDWSWYHPKQGDYKKIGEMERFIFTALDHGKMRSNGLFTRQKVREGFEKASRGENVVIAYALHDFDPKKTEDIILAHEWLVSAAKEFGIKWAYETATGAAKKVLGKENKEKLVINFSPGSGLIESSKFLFGLPFVAIKHPNSYDCQVIPAVKKTESTYQITEIPEKGRIYISATDSDFNNSILTCDL